MVKGILPKRTKAFEFSLSSIFVDYYMPHANASFVKVYLYGMRQCFAGETLDIHPVAVALDMLDSDVIQAWKYWDKKGVVRYADTDEGCEIEFLELSVPEKASANADVPKKEKSPAPSPLSLSVPDAKPAYEISEITDACAKDKLLSGMFTEAERLLKKPLSQNDMRTLYSFHDWLGLPCEVILMILEHCVSIKKTSMRYIEKVALGWVDDGITTVQYAQQYLNDNTDRQKLLRKYKKLLKITDRELSDGETAFILSWTGSMGLSEELIRAAYERTVTYTGKLSLPYMNKILSSWHKKGIHAPEDIPADAKSEAAGKPQLPKRQTKPSSRFSNYTQRGNDSYDQAEAAAMARIKNFKKRGDES